MTDDVEPQTQSAETESATTVFVAEDEAIIRLDIVETLEALGFEVVGQCGRGDEAEELIRELQPQVAILDIKMPGRTGIEVARALTDDLVCAVVILSAFSQKPLVEDAVAAGVFAYLLKPFQRSELAVQIEVALARYRQLRDKAGEVEDLEQRLADRVILDRAKGVLIDKHGLSEADAMRFVQQEAMNQRRPVRDVAAEVLDGVIVPKKLRP